MEVDTGYFQSFFTLSDLDVQKILIYLSPFLSDQLVTPKSISEGEDSLTTFKIEKGAVWADLLFTGWPGIYVVSEHFKNALGLIKGANFIPVTILDKKLQKIDINYYRFQVFGKSGKLLKDLCKKQTATRIPGGPEYIKLTGLFFEPDSWDGSEVFSPENTLYIFITSKIKELLSFHSVSNVKMRPITDVEAFFV